MNPIEIQPDIRRLEVMIGVPGTEPKALAESPGSDAEPADEPDLPEDWGRIPDEALMSLDLTTLVQLLNHAEAVATRIHREVWAQKEIPLASVEMWGRIKRNIHDASAIAQAWKTERQNK